MVFSWINKEAKRKIFQDRGLGKFYPFAENTCLLYNMIMNERVRFYFEKQMLFSLDHMRYTDCPYYPCHHMNRQNCFFCYCPFYPCGDEQKGKWLLTENEKIWDCSPCTWIHEDEVVRKILDLFYEGKSLSQIKDILW